MQRLAVAQAVVRLLYSCTAEGSIAAAVVALWKHCNNVCRLPNGAMKHEVTDDFDPDGMSMAINMTMDVDVRVPGQTLRSIARATPIINIMPVV